MRDIQTLDDIKLRSEEHHTVDGNKSASRKGGN